MSRTKTPSAVELDRFYRQGGLRALASPQVHYDDPECPHSDCSRRMEWIDFRFGADRASRPLVIAWWSGMGFVGRCPACQGWLHFTTRAIQAVDGDQAAGLPQLPSNWSTLARIA